VTFLTVAEADVKLACLTPLALGPLDPCTMSDAAEIRRRLSRLGRQKPKVPRAATAIGRSMPTGLPPGEELSTPHGTAFRIDTPYPLDHAHGPSTLADVLGYEPILAAEVVRQPKLASATFERMAFLDTETTGLVGGAGTIVFLVGVGTFEGDAFRLRQYFLRDPSEEPGMLHALQEDLESVQGFVTFNGQTFDVPLLETRYRIGLRLDWPLTGWPQLDLLHPARRLWRRSLPDCSLGTIERRVLGVSRTQDDVPGALIPAMYLDYLRTGDASEMSRVLYHNAVDILSLVGLTSLILDRHRLRDPADLSAAEALGLARWHQTAGRTGEAESAWQAALSADERSIKLEALRRLAGYLKQRGRRSEAVSGWRTWHELAPADPEPCIELAKYYEWETGDLEQAVAWSEAALACLDRWPSDWRRDQQAAEIDHRLQRLSRKLNLRE
jgi:uncharacterized protein YprB with RNaseH-like and TPR domain